MRKKVFVGLSGGVDSAVSAALLKSQGYDVTGVFIKVWQPEFIECTWREDRLDAMRVAATLGIPFREIDLSEEYKREVVDSMVADYARGVTPNPDVLCNRTIKFGHFLGWARESGAGSIATGHYARIAQRDGRMILLRGADPNKDQSYFLWQIGEEELARTLFPIGDLTKEDVRALAKKFGLPNAQKPDSQGLCFVGDVRIDEFLARFIPVTAGMVLDTAGRVVGEHQGAALYTIGQRHGFTFQQQEVAGKYPERAKRVERVTPHHVVSVNVVANTVTVSPSRSDAAKTQIMLRDVHWINEVPSFPFETEVQARYRETPVRARVERTRGKVHVTFAEPHLVSLGQSLVVYRSEQCLGGGVIAL